MGDDIGKATMEGELPPQATVQDLFPNATVLPDTPGSDATQIQEQQARVLKAQKEAEEAAARAQKAAAEARLTALQVDEAEHRKVMREATAMTPEEAKAQAEKSRAEAALAAEKRLKAEVSATTERKVQKLTGVATKLEKKFGPITSVEKETVNLFEQIRTSLPEDSPELQASMEKLERRMIAVAKASDISVEAAEVAFGIVFPIISAFAPEDRARAFDRLSAAPTSSLRTLINRMLSGVTTASERRIRGKYGPATRSEQTPLTPEAVPPALEQVFVAAADGRPDSPGAGDPRNTLEQMASQPLPAGETPVTETPSTHP